MGGFFGVASTTDCVADLFYGTDYHSHLGTRRGGLVTAGRAIRDLIAGRRILFCEDSIVRGTQLADIIRRVFDHGAR
jgi:hypothetical protein